MGNYEQNCQISCTYCGYNPIMGKESEPTKDRWGNIIVECRWTCSRCGSLVRSDEKRLPNEIKKESDNGKKINNPKQ